MLSRVDERALRDMGRTALEKSRKASEVESPFSRSYGTVKTVYDDGRVDVDLGNDEFPSMQYGIRMTTACSGVKVNDRVVVDVFAHVPLVTGILAHDNRQYVDVPVRLYNKWDAPLSGAVRLSQRADAFTFIDVWGCTNDNAECFTRVIDPNDGTVFNLTASHNTDIGFVKWKTFQISGDTINTYRNGDLQYVTAEWSSDGTFRINDYIKIVAVYGYTYQL